jgi:hypothetical protein
MLSNIGIPEREGDNNQAVSGADQVYYKHCADPGGGPRYTRIK